MTLSSASSTSTPSFTTTASPGTTRSYNVATSHKVLAPVSIALLLPAVIFLRLALPSNAPSKCNSRHSSTLYAAAILIVIAFGTGIAALALSFTSMKSAMTMQKRTSTHATLTTGHGKVGLGLFVGLYGLVPILIALRYMLHSNDNDHQNARHPRPRASSIDTAEKLHAISTLHGAGLQTPPALPRRRVHSWTGALWPSSRMPEDSDSEQSGPASPRPFEVTNRPQRTRRNHTASASVSHQLRPLTMHDIGDKSWMERRRSLSAVVSKPMDFYYFWLLLISIPSG